MLGMLKSLWKTIRNDIPNFKVSSALAIQALLT